MGKFVDLTGDKYGKLTVIERLPEKSNPIKWRCLCDCGKEVVVRGNNLRSGNTKSCGCIDMTNKLGKYKDITGQRFGRLTVIERCGYQYNPSGKRRILWKCLCDCGNEKIVSLDHLRDGDVTSCGCYFREMASALYTYDLTGKKFGRLTVLKRASKPGDPSGVKWLCQCTCGRKSVVHSTSLRAGLTMSCGCLKMSKGERIVTSLLRKYGISFDREYIYDDLLSDKGFPLRFDFALFNKAGEVAGLLEFQGIQHYIERPKDKEFGRQQREETDEKKRQYCRAHKIRLFEIKYDEHIEYATLSVIVELYANPVPSSENSEKV